MDNAALQDTLGEKKDHEAHPAMWDTLDWLRIESTNVIDSVVWAVERRPLAWASAMLGLGMLCGVGLAEIFHRKKYLHKGAINELGTD